MVLHGGLIAGIAFTLSGWFLSYPPSTWSCTYYTPCWVRLILLRGLRTAALNHQSCFFSVHCNVIGPIQTTQNFIHPSLKVFRYRCFLKGWFVWSKNAQTRWWMLLGLYFLSDLPKSRVSIKLWENISHWSERGSVQQRIEYIHCRSSGNI